MKVINASLDAVAVKPSQYPAEVRPEIAFVGRSNVGKSSLINCLVNRKALARTSQTPGKTRTINFYGVDKTLYFVDLPGYGYAKTSRYESSKWGKMAETYLLNRAQLKCIVMLVDIRHAPSAGDAAMYSWLKHYEYNMAVVATKLDKIKRSRLEIQLSAIRQAFGMDGEEPLIPFSSETRAGKESLLAIIESAVQT